MNTHLKLLGPVQIIQACSEPDKGSKPGPVPRFRSRRTVALLGYLAAERRPHAREHLAVLFWPDDPSARGRSNLRRELYNLSRLLPDCWQANSQVVNFSPSPGITVDIDTLKRLESEQRWRGAADLLAGEFLEGLYLQNNPDYETWLLAERERWREKSQSILNNACDESIRQGCYTDALSYARRLLQLAPWDENAHRQVMQLLAWKGRREEAFMQFALCKQALADELAIEPSVETEALYQRIKAGDLGVPPALPAFLAAGAEDLRDGRPFFALREREMAWLNKQLEGALSGHGGIAFMTGGPGRGKTALLDAFSDRALAAYPDLLIARGNCDAYAGFGDPYLPFRNIMAMLSGDVEGKWAAGSISTAHARRLWNALPLVVQALLENGSRLLDIFLTGPALLDRAKTAEPAGAPWLEQLADRVQHGQIAAASVEQSALFEQFSNVLLAVARIRPLLLLLDDVQWMDAASIGLLFHLVRRIAQEPSRILILCAYRPEEIARNQSAAQHQLVRALSEFRRIFGDVWLSLGWADEREGRQFVDALLDNQPNNLDETFRSAFSLRTAGHPLFTVELLRAMRERGDLIKDANGIWQEGPDLDWQLMPARVEAVIEARIQQLEPQYRDLLSIASVEGEQFTAQVMAQVQDLAEGPLLHLLVQELGNNHRLVQEQETYQTNHKSIARFGFRHVLFQEYLYKQLGKSERAFLHGAVAAAMENVYADNLEPISVQLAQHYDKAGDYGRALFYFTLAAGHAASFYAYDAAIAHYTHALALANAEAVHEPPLQSDRAALYYGRGLAYRTIGEFEPARDDLDLALELSGAITEKRLQWKVLIELGKLWSSRDYTLSHGYLEQALDLAVKINDPEIVGCSLNRIGNWHANDENPLRAISYHEEALRIFEELNDRSHLAETLDLLGISHLLGGDYAAAIAYYNRAIELFREMGDPLRMVSSLISRGLGATGSLLLALAGAQLPRDPLDDLVEAGDIARRIRSSPDAAWSSWATALLHTVRGQYGPALEAGQQGLKIASSIQHREWRVGSHHALGILYNELLQPEMALQELEPALTLAGELQSPYWTNHVTAALAKSYILLDDLSAALHCLDAVLSCVTPMDTAGTRYCWARRAQLALAMDEPSLALNIAERLIDSAAGLQAGDVVSFLWLIKGEALAKMGRLGEARDILLDGRDHTREAQERFLLWRFHAALAHLNQTMGKDMAAATETAAARALIEEMAATVTDERLAEGFKLRAFAML
jgi:DNA-binding SARP family transcriptional activator/tetratricopeptide (TPR) repeat protein